MDYTRLYKLIEEIPKGQVATYGQLARLAGLTPRQVGHALGTLNGAQARRVPWHRVVNAQGRISLRAEDGGEELQARRLRREKIVFSKSGRIDLKRFAWPGPFNPDEWL
ncbi:MAG: MGMT family protein [Alphaproteobacteria bacterium]|jgi:methylated-DNA-protein-cysteine methyltransferase-like protein|nr:MGMT family protein [Alphaproteobacteria bacterium]MBO6629649.1 MGMT family protein [Alphaproteobacteria bacterium]MDF1626876.1 MGMT family protein [Parvibaculaceae bacterium]